MSQPLRIAVVGCGAIARSFHLPALASIPGVAERLVLVDRDARRAEETKEEFGAAKAVPDHRVVTAEVDGAIVAVPQECHGEVAGDFLAAGVPVLCEKPLATTLQEGSALVEAARRTGTILAVNNVRRFFPAIVEARNRISSGSLGEVRRIEIHEGSPLDWPLMSGTAFGRDGTGKGVLQDLGAHTLDMVCWWLGTRSRITRYLDDALGGSEAVARVEFESGRCRGVVHLSWLSRLPNTFRLEGTEGSVEGRIRAWDAVRVREGTRRPRKVRLRPEVPSYPELNTHVIRNFLRAVRRQGRPAVPAEEVLPSLEMIEGCYARRTRFPMPWLKAAEKLVHVDV